MRRVLLVDDSALIRNSMHAVLEPYGVELEHAENGAIAVAKAAASRWDLIFLDVVMPIMDGPTALREIRARGNLTPVVLVTSVSTASVVASAVKLGGVFYIAKPFSPAHIRAIADKLLKLDPAVLASPPRVLLQHTDPALPARLRKLLPAYIALDSSQSTAQSIDLAEAIKRDLVIVESGALGDELPAVAGVLRQTLPAAGIFAMTDDATASSLWHDEAGLDGRLPRSLDDALVRGFLIPNFLRTLATLERSVARAASFRGPAGYLPVYATMLGRALIDCCRELDATAELEIDLQDVSPEPDAVVAVVAVVDRALRAAGLAPAFRLTSEIRAQVRGRLDRVVVV